MPALPPSQDTGDRPSRPTVGRHLQLLKAGQRIGYVHQQLQRLQMLQHLPSRQLLSELESAGEAFESLGFDTIGGQFKLLAERSPEKVSSEDVWFVIETFMRIGAEQDDPDYHSLAAGISIGWAASRLISARLGRKQLDEDQAIIIECIEGAGEHIKAITIDSHGKKIKDKYETKINEAVRRAVGPVRASGTTLNNPVLQDFLDTFKGEIAQYIRKGFKPPHGDRRN